MGSTSPQIKALISLAYEYRIRRSEKNLQTLQRQLQILCVVTDLKIFEPSCMETLEFYICLEQLLTEVEPKSSLTWKIINLLSHISMSSKIRGTLRDEIDLLPLLTNILISKLNKDKTQKILQLIQEVSYGIKLQRSEAWVIKLIPFLVSSILESGSLDDCCEFSIVTLSNLCRGNPPAIASLCELSERKSLIRMVTHLRNPSLKVQLLVSEMMLYVNMDHSMLDKDQIIQTLDLLFTVATDSFAEKDDQLLQLSTDVFEEIINHSYLREAIKGYHKFEGRCQNLLCYVNDENRDKSTAILFEFVSLLVGMEHPHLLGLSASIFAKALPWLNCKECGSSALRLLHTLTQVSDDSLIYSQVDKLIDALKDNLFVKEDLSFCSSKLNWLISLLSFVETSCNKDTSFHFKLADCLDPKQFVSFLNAFLNLIESDAQSTVHSLERSYLEFTPGCSSMESTSFNPCKRRRTSLRIINLKSEVVARLVYIGKMLAIHKPEFKLEHERMLTNPKVMKHVVICQRANDEVAVSLATKLLSDGNIPTQSISTLVEAQTCANLSSDLLPGIEKLTPSERGRVINGTPCSAISDMHQENVEMLIKRLNGTTEKLELKDIPLTDVMELYEYKLAALAHNENALEDALAAADKQVRHTKKALLQSRAESDRLRCLLEMWESRLQQSLKEKIEVQNNLLDIKNSSRKLREELVKEKTDVERRLSQKQSEMLGMNQELSAKSEEVKRLQKQLTDSLKENQKLSNSLHHINEEHEKSKKGVEDLEKLVSKYEKSESKLKSKNAELELVIQSHEKTIAEKEVEVDELTKTNASLKRIQDLIHNMSSGRT